MSFTSVGLSGDNSSSVIVVVPGVMFPTFMTLPTTGKVDDSTEKLWKTEFVWMTAS